MYLWNILFTLFCCSGLSEHSLPFPLALLSAEPVTSVHKSRSFHLQKGQGASFISLSGYILTNKLAHKIELLRTIRFLSFFLFSFFSSFLPFLLFFFFSFLLMQVLHPVWASNSQPRGQESHALDWASQEPQIPGFFPCTTMMCKEKILFLAHYHVQCFQV